MRLAVEDELSEHIPRRILSERDTRYDVTAVYRGRGFGYLRKHARAFNRSATAAPFLLLTDLDRSDCAPTLIAEWLGRPRHPDFLLRVAVREAEAWLLGDDSGLKAFFGARGGGRHDRPEELPDPKAELLRMAWSARRELQERLVRRDRRSGRLAQGPDYNGALGEFVARHWSVSAASSRCRSLRKLICALDGLEARHGSR
ncbi:MAG: hypothetical protein FJ109_04955 [Deltaproteobacteria bacterium]|nr:hypothetical protein [Deltaproteobacteria bacterium]